MTPEELTELNQAIEKLSVPGCYDEDLAVVLKAAKRTRELEIEAMDEQEGSYRLILRQGEILTGAINAIRGVPPEGTSWGHHDLVVMTQGVMLQLQDLRRSYDLACRMLTEPEHHRKIAARVARDCAVIFGSMNVACKDIEAIIAERTDYWLKPGPTTEV